MLLLIDDNWSLLSLYFDSISAIFAISMITSTIRAIAPAERMKCEIAVNRRPFLIPIVIMFTISNIAKAKNAAPNRTNAVFTVALVVPSLPRVLFMSLIAAKDMIPRKSEMSAKIGAATYQKMVYPDIFFFVIAPCCTLCCGRAVAGAAIGAAAVGLCCSATTWF